MFSGKDIYKAEDTMDLAAVAVSAALNVVTFPGQSQVRQVWLRLLAEVCSETSLLRRRDLGGFEPDN
jgi:hypothetical protein